MTPRRFKLFVPGGGYPLKVSGKTGAMPDARLTDGMTFHRRALPNMDQMIFRFAVIAAKECVLNFYHMGDFFIISARVKELFVHHFRGELETTPICVLHENGNPASYP